MRHNSYGSLKSQASQDTIVKLASRSSRSSRYSQNSQATLSSLTSQDTSDTPLSQTSHQPIWLNNDDIQKYIEYIAYIEKDIATVSNDYYEFAKKYDKRMYDFINRHQDKTNKLFIDLRYREAECRILNNKIEYIGREVCKIKGDPDIKKDSSYIPIVYDKDSGDSVSDKILLILCVYTLYVVSLVITY